MVTAPQNASHDRHMQPSRRPWRRTWRRILQFHRKTVIILVGLLIVIIGLLGNWFASEWKDFTDRTIKGIDNGWIPSRNGLFLVGSFAGLVFASSCAYRVLADTFVVDSNGTTQDSSATRRASANRRRRLGLTIFVLLAAFFGNWLVSEGKDWLDAWAKGASQNYHAVWSPVLVGVALAGCAICSLFAIVWTRAVFLRDRFHLANLNPPRRPHLVLFLSELPKTAREEEMMPTKLAGSLVFRLTEDLSTMASFKESNPYWRWEMPLRAIAYHVGELRTATIICSVESLPQLPWFDHLFQKYQANTPELASVKLQTLVWKKVGEKNVMIWKQASELQTDDLGWEFENFNLLSIALSGLIQDLMHRSEEAVLENELVIDFSGGQKVTSAVAAALTFNTDMMAQYVQTNWPWDVKGYSLVNKAADTWEGI